MLIRLLLAFVVVVLARPCQAWYDSEDLEIFDLVEEVKQDFYEFMGLNDVSGLAILC